MKKKITGDLYKLDFADGKSYIGACTCGVEKRYKSHKREAVGGSKTLVHKAWRKLGDPKLIVLGQNLLEDELWIAEKEAAAYYNTQVPSGYNSYSVSGVAPGSLGKPLSLRARKKRYKALLKRWEDPKEREKQRQAMLQLYQNHPEERAKRGRPHSKKRRKQHSDALIEYYKNNSVSEEISKKISQALSGKSKTEEHKRKLSLAALRREETKRIARQTSGCHMSIP